MTGGPYRHPVVAEAPPVSADKFCVRCDRLTDHQSHRHAEATAGRPGLAPSWHEREAARRPHPRPCRVSVLPGYPYDCPAATFRPDDIVLACDTHGCWWTVSPVTGRDRTDEHHGVPHPVDTNHGL